MKRIDKLLDRLYARFPKTPTFEEFLEKWETLGELDKSMYVFCAECPEYLGDRLSERDKVIFGYLDRMGLVKEHFDLAAFVEELNGRNEWF